MRRIALALALVVSTTVSAGAAANATQPQVHLRVDQVGYAIGEQKTAYVLAKTAIGQARFEVKDDRGRVVFTGRAGASNGQWSPAFQAVQPLDFSGLRRRGTYTIHIGQSASPPFRVDTAKELFSGLVKDTLNFFDTQRDTAHLTDKDATVYHHPVFSGDGGDVPAEPLKPWANAAKADVHGGWFDAGDFVKFTHASAYALSNMLYAQRALGAQAPAALKREGEFGLAWLDKVWDKDARNLFVQVGIGTGSEEFGFLGDHDVWRLPEADDALETGPGDPWQFIKYRPVFPAGAPGEKISPNLAGRGSAAFGLAAQLAAQRGDKAAARKWFAEGWALYTSAKTTDVGELVTAFPHAYYPEDSWQDDMEFGATELALAALKIKDLRAFHLVRDAARWAHEYIASDAKDALNLYDTSALAHADLAALLPHGSLKDALIGDLRRQLDDGVTSAQGHPFRHAVDVTGFDAATRSFGFAATAKLYERLTGDRRYSSFGTSQRNFAFGNNAWGTSLMVGAGTVYPQCPQHQVSNLRGEVRGAVVNGPNGAENFEWIGIPDGANACPADGVNRFAEFDTPTARYLDDVRAWPSSEPAIDFTATALLALALTVA
ncbi:glycoside hydrolase family 9 protein [Catelliglobosispora koreensis]|uniref:glycoside hydrolase family 9 protein n=1 Tax=Catelliglobosispora koreensis TaxID=129052 RepID=UPI000373E7AC|nr:glycoside hydrolase family 9 protein [Catelliglobosispora koreensis]